VTLATTPLTGVVVLFATVLAIQAPAVGTVINLGLGPSVIPDDAAFATHRCYKGCSIRCVNVPKAMATLGGFTADQWVW